MSKFAFELGQRVAILGSEVGDVIGRAEYHQGEMVNQYWVRYVAGDGRAVEAWWSEKALTHA